MISEGSILESKIQSEFNEMLLKKITQGAKLADIMVEISKHSEKTRGVKSDLKNY